MTLNIFLKAKNRVTGNFRVPIGGMQKPNGVMKNPISRNITNKTLR